ncbi:aldolase/citrate lyase/malate synthase family protein [Gallaecimonas mangrovi]|uniref:hypothetical protein n=1 Tax=Gallaecimonas mangrovi TaxID=2291597 RepID=UPI000E1FE5F3|nr:hypothetical protein [Gallaecimonas mangrovi]
MNMLTFDRTEIQEQQKPFIAEAIFAVEASLQCEKQVKAKQLLDNLFPLEAGSHQDVTSYVIDYHHLLAYFKDGSHSGLKHPCQFVAYEGEKESPCSILFRDGSGGHVDVAFGCHQGSGNVALAFIDDVQLETCTTFTQMADQDTPTAGMRHWISLVKGDKPEACVEDKDYTAKNGEDYRLNYCFSL